MLSQLAARRGPWGYVLPVHTEILPYTPEPLQFRFPSLVALAGRLPLGGGREVVLAALLTARIAESLMIEDGVQDADRATRAAAAKVWLASLAMPAALRPVFLRCIDASSEVGGARLKTAAALRGLAAAVGNQLDPSSMQEIEQLSRHLATA